ncbi:hypothetical protein BCIN_06g01570 [Botrytis cinerea B05.10]|uniref:C2H2-type domain-containing protein n=1 Tax=Botryotinia fuckeliana (strain B05.10) TaxID=332648 RepID=A0A384JJZ0_BOTFB|nr:hypothetical protein BCIN_06g01570 [Botrytis cinerea B05.10]ATZ50664.1 hypothetical protein BCIN_06g01570 [Botrytis cinerea B05.10]
MSISNAGRAPVDEEFNSSDLEYDVPVEKSRRILGQRSIVKIIENAQELRVSSKKTSKQLSYGTGRQNTQDVKHRAVQRLNNFRTHSLKQVDLKVAPSGEDMLRFMDSIIGVIVPNRRNKAVPNASTAAAMIQVLVEYSIFTYNRSLTPQEKARIHTWYDDAKKNGRLTTGKWAERIRVGISTLSMMSKAWLSFHVKNGTISWDITIYKLFSVVLTSALACRVGDLARSTLSYTLEYARWQDVEIAIPTDSPGTIGWKDFEAQFTLRYTKFKRDTPRNNDIVYLSPLDDEDTNHICPLTLMILHAMRHGLVMPVGATSLQEVIDYAAASESRAIEWVQPTYPLMASLAHSRLCLEVPAQANQITQTVKLMGIMTGIIGTITGHSLRTGAARDVAHLPSKVFDGVGITSSSVAAVLNHSTATFNRGISRDYAGEQTALVFNARAKVMPTPRGLPKVTNEDMAALYKKPIPLKEVQLWQAENRPDDPDPNSTNSRRNARNAMRHGRLEKGWETVPSTRQTTSNTILRDLPTNPMVLASSVTSSATKEASIRSESTPASPMPHPLETSFISQIDPALLSQDQIDQLSHMVEDEGYMTAATFDMTEHDLSEVEVVSSDLAKLQILIAPMVSDGSQTIDHVDGDGEDDGDVDLDEMHALLGVEEDEPDNQSGEVTSAHGFVAKWSRVNIVCNSRFERAWLSCTEGRVSLEDSIGPFCQFGNTRDSPTPFQFVCTTPTCDYSTITKPTLTQHVDGCTTEKIEAKLAVPRPFTCNRAGCQASFTSKHDLSNHTNHNHAATRKPCKDAETWGCDPIVMYTVKELAAHRHTHGFPTRCTFDGCEHQRQFASRNSLRSHIKKTHKISSAGYMPAEIRKRSLIDQPERSDAQSQERKRKRDTIDNVDEPQ